MKKLCGCGSYADAYKVACEQVEKSLKAGDCGAWLTAVGLAQHMVAVAKLKIELKDSMQKLTTITEQEAKTLTAKVLLERLNEMHDELMKLHEAARAAKAVDKELASKLPEPPRVDDMLLEVKGKGFTGDVCVHCQSPNMIQAGHCQVCTNCGETTGCS